MGLFDAYSTGAPNVGLLQALASYQPTPNAGFPGDQGAIPQNAQPTAGAIPPNAMPSPNSSEPGVLGALQNFLGGNRNMLMQLGAGIASGGLMKGLPMAAQGAQQDYDRQLKMAQMGMTYQALLNRGMSESDARLAILNPEVMKAYAGNFGPDPASVTNVKDQTTGQESSALLRPRAGNLQAINPSSLPRVPSPAAVAHLRSNPASAADFDLTYGTGSAQRYYVGSQ